MVAWLVQKKRSLTKKSLMVAGSEWTTQERQPFCSFLLPSGPARRATVSEIFCQLNCWQLLHWSLLSVGSGGCEIRLRPQAQKVTLNDLSHRSPPVSTVCICTETHAEREYVQVRLEGKLTMKVTHVKLVDRLEVEIYYSRLPKEGNAVITGPCFWLMGMAIMDWIEIEGTLPCYWRRKTLLHSEDVTFSNMKRHTNEVRKALWHNEFILIPVSQRNLHVVDPPLVRLGTLWFIPFRPKDGPFSADLYTKSDLSEIPRIGILWRLRYRMLKLWRTGERLKPILDFVNQYRP